MDEEVKLIVRGVDAGATKVVKETDAELNKLGRDAVGVAGQVGRVTGALQGLGGWIKAGLGIGLGMQLERVLSDVLGTLSSAFFDAINGGAAWAQQVKDIQRVTGMSAQETSTWLAIMERVGVPVDQAGRTLAMFGRNLAENENLFKKLGIATRDSNGDFLDAYTILTNTRRAFNEQGEALANTGAAQELFSRSGYKVLEVLQLSDAQFKAYAADAAAAGQVVGSDLTAAVERFHRAQNGLGGVIQGLQAQIFGALGPTLEHFVEAFSTWVQANMQTIVQFVANVANYIAGVIGGLFGIDLSAKTTEQTVASLGTTTAKTGKAFDGLATSEQKTKAAGDAVTSSLNAQIKAIDAQIAAINRRSDARHAAETRARLDESLASAKAQLADLKGNAPFTEGLSNAEATLARQKHAQDIIDAQKAVADANGAISMFEADQSAQAERARLESKKRSLQDELNAHKQSVSARAAGDEWLTGVNLKADATIGQAATDLYKGITERAKEWRDQGVAFSKDLKGAVTAVTSAILGTEVVEEKGGRLISSRSGGLVGALGAVGDAFRWIIDQIGPFIDELKGLEKMFKDFIAWLKSLTAPGANARPGVNFNPHDIPGGATGAFVPAQPGGVVMRLGEGSEDEWVIPRSKMGGSGGRAPVVVNIALNSVWPPTIQDAQRIIDFVEEQLGERYDNVAVGMPGFIGR